MVNTIQMVAEAGRIYTVGYYAGNEATVLKILDPDFKTVYYEAAIKHGFGTSEPVVRMSVHELSGVAMCSFLPDSSSSQHVMFDFFSLYDASLKTYQS